MQLANLGSEFSRAMKWKGKDDKVFWSEVERFLEYINAMIAQPGLTVHRKKELLRVREVCADKFIDAQMYGGSVDSLQKYFDDYVLLINRRQ